MCNMCPSWNQGLCLLKDYIVNVEAQVCCIVRDLMNTLSECECCCTFSGACSCTGHSAIGWSRLERKQLHSLCQLG